MLVMSVEMKVAGSVAHEASGLEADIIGLRVICVVERLKS